jgi:hypothetical protein
MQFMSLVYFHRFIHNLSILLVIFLDQRQYFWIDIVGLFSDQPRIKYQQHCFIGFTNVVIFWQLLNYLFFRFCRF